MIGTPLLRPDLTVFIHSLEGGGAERVAVTLCNALAEKNKRVHLIVLDKHGAYWNMLSSNVEVFCFERQRMRQALFLLVRYIYRHQPHALLCFMTRANMIGIAANLLAFKRTRLVISERAVYSYFGQGGLKKLLAPLLPLLYHFADRVICVSQGVADDLANFVSLPPQKVTVIYNPAIRKELYQLKEEPIDHPWFAPGQPPVILAVGAFRPEKNYTLLLRAFAGVDKKYNARLLILGDGPGRPALKQLAQDLKISDHMDMPGFASNPFAYMAHAALFVMCSDTEGMPNALIEALACGTPVVATDCPGGMREILGDQHYGLLVPKGNQAALSGAINATLENPVRAQARVQAFTKEQMYKFTPETVIPQYCDALQV